mmetsp:Transcript_21747/g.26808  ORF Transcript_21747/g.26808 Transcript_21747/m.26808 type:complete len:86 (+) Transcript_21747:174-431(+)
MQGISRPDLEAQSFTLALQGLLLTPDYFCARTVKMCSTPVYKTMSMQNDIADIMAKKPADAHHFIDKLYAEIAEDQKERKTITLV